MKRDDRPVRDAVSFFEAESPQQAAELWLCPPEGTRVCRVSESSVHLPGAGFIKTFVEFSADTNSPNPQMYYFVLSKDWTVNDFDKEKR